MKLFTFDIPDTKSVLLKFDGSISTYKIVHFIDFFIKFLWHAAHAHKVDERNYECMHISHSLFSKKWNPYARPAHITIWLGDLNYRIHGIDTQPARNLIQKDLHEVSCQHVLFKLLLM